VQAWAFGNSTIIVSLGRSGSATTKWMSWSASNLASTNASDALKHFD
jgi:hypothetical protein